MINYIKKHTAEVISFIIGIICAAVFFVANRENKEMTSHTPITVSFSLGCPDNFSNNLQIYYTETPEQTFSPQRRIEVPAHGGQNNIAFQLPSDILHLLRVGFGSHPGTVSIGNITVSGSKTKKIPDLSNIQTNDINDIIVTQDKISITSDKLDPYIIFNQPLDIRTRVTHTALVAQSLTFFFGGALLCYLALLLIFSLLGKAPVHAHPFKIATSLIAATMASALATHVATRLGNVFQEEITLSMHINAEHQFSFSTFYTTTPEQQFSESQICSTEITAGEQDINIIIPAPHIAKLRIDFGSAPGKVTASNIFLNGQKQIAINNLNNTSSNDLDAVSMNNGVLSISSVRQDPWIIWNEGMENDQKEIPQLNIVFFLSTFVIVFAILFLAFSKLGKAFNDGVKTEDIALMVVFTAFVAVPSFLLSDDTTSKSEKRSLTAKPDFVTNEGFNKDFTSQFANWYNDHFPARQDIINIHNKIFIPEGEAHNENVIEGADNWLFYNKDRVIENYANIRLITHAQLNDIQRYFSAINNWCNAHGKKFIVMICPNKPTIYGEKVKHINRLNAPSDADMVCQKLNEAGIAHVFTRDTLLKHKSQNNHLYYQQDTHCTPYGNYYNYLSLLSEVNKYMPIYIVPLDSFASIKGHKDDGDLYTMLPGLKQDTTVYETYYCTQPFIAHTVRNSQTKTDELINSTKTKSIFVIGDSFSGYSLHFYLAATFGKTHVDRSHQYFLTPETANEIAQGYDLLVMEVVERHLQDIASMSLPPQIQPYAPK